MAREPGSSVGESVTMGAERLEGWVGELLEAAGLVDEAAAVVAQSLVETNLRGIDSHGVLRVPIYIERLRAGLLNDDPEPFVVSEDGAVAVVDADGGPGQVAGYFATDLAVRLARAHGVGVVTVRGSSHYGAAGLYALRAAREGLLAISTTNAEPYVVPYGGSGPALGTNPIAFAAPSTDAIFVLDMATSQVAVGKVFLAREQGRAIPESWAVDERGAPTTDAEEARFAVPLGGYKGYGLGLMVEILSGLLAGAGFTHSVGDMYNDFSRAQDVGHFFLVIDPERTVGRDAFADALERLLSELRANPPAPGFDAVLVAGDAELSTQSQRSRDGIPLPRSLFDTLSSLARELGVAVPATR